VGQKEPSSVPALAGTMFSMAIVAMIIIAARPKANLRGFTKRNGCRLELFEDNGTGNRQWQPINRSIKYIIVINSTMMYI
jgi:hypothetical protein